LTIDASSAVEAEREANEMGFLVGAVRPASAAVVVEKAAPRSHPPAKREPSRTRGHDAQAPTVNVHVPRRGSSLGIAAIVLGVVAIAFCWIPLVGILSVPLSGIGLVAALIGFIVALDRKGSGIGLPIAGGALSALALAVALAMNYAVFSGIERFNQELAAANEERTAATPTVYTPVASAAENAEAQAPTDLDRVPSVPTPPTPPAPPLPDDAWIPLDADRAALASDPSFQPGVFLDGVQGVTNGEISLWINRARVAKPKFRSSMRDNWVEGREPMLLLTLRVKNDSETRKLDYVSWTIDAREDGVRVIDEHGNDYRLTGDSISWEYDGQVRIATVYPGDAISDTLIIERPVDAAKTIYLTLPGIRVGAKHDIRLSYDTSRLSQ
jgi:hypothetical protein